MKPSSAKRARKLETVADLQPDKRNANKGTVRGLAMLEDSIQQFGAGRSILVDKNGNVIAGNKTLQSAVDADLPIEVVETDGTKLVVVQRTDLDLYADAKARQLAYADNRVAEIDLAWDAEALLADLADGVDLSALFDADELDALLAGVRDEPPGDPGAQIDKAAELRAKYKTAVGQVWQLGRHRLAVGDCTQEGLVASVMQDKRATAVVTDSPYGIERKGIANDKPETLRKLFDGCLAVLPIDNAIIINFQSPRLFTVWLDAIKMADHKFERALWFYDETDVTFPWRGWLMCSQIALVSSVGNPKWSDGKYSHDCYLVKTAGQQDDSGGHTTAKPLDVVRDLVEHTTGLVFDPFVGSGTTLIACEQLHRDCRAIELDPSYAAVTIQRWEAATGQTAILERLADMGLAPERAEA